MGLSRSMSSVASWSDCARSIRFAHLSLPRTGRCRHPRPLLTKRQRSEAGHSYRGARAFQPPNFGLTPAGPRQRPSAPHRNGSTFVSACHSQQGRGQPVAGSVLRALTRSARSRACVCSPGSHGRSTHHASRREVWKAGREAGHVLQELVAQETARPECAHARGSRTVARDAHCLPAASRARRAGTSPRAIPPCVLQPPGIAASASEFFGRRSQQVLR